MARNSESDQQQLIVRMPVELHSAVRDRADADDLTMAQLVRRALRDYLSEERLAAPA
jgi:predicted HicB family RNase H-like nuclease